MILITNNTVTTLKIIFCFLCVFLASHSLHGQSRHINPQDKHNITTENTNIYGSISSGINDVCAISGANKPIKDKTIGNTQQNKCGNIDAIIPILIALFFILFFLLLLAPIFIVHYARTNKISGVPSRIRICI